MAVLFLADRRLQRDGLLADLLDLAHLRWSHLHLGCDLISRRLTSQVLEQLALDARQLVDRLDHVYRNTDRASLVCNCPRDRLTNPPGCISRELEPLRVVEFLDGANEAEVALLNEVEKRHTSPDVPFRDRHHESKVGLDE